MSKTTELLDEVKQKKEVTTDYALAKVLELPRGHICDYYKGNRFPNEFACLQIAKAIGRSYEEISAIVRIEAEKDENRRNVWKDYLKRIAGYAASIMLSLLAGLLFVTFIVTTTPPAHANTGLQKSSFKIIQIMRVSSRKGWTRFRTLIAVARRMLANAFPRACIAG